MRKTLKRSRWITILLLGLALVPAAFAAGGARVFADHHQALLESGLDLSSPVFIEPVSYRKGVAVYRFREALTGREAKASVSVLVNPLTGATGGFPNTVSPSVAGGAAKVTFIGSADRCSVAFYKNINYGTLLMTANLDLNDWGSLGGSFNDQVTSIVTGCNALFIWDHEEWAGSGLFVPANFQLPNLSAYSFNDKMSSHYIVCQ